MVAKGAHGIVSIGGESPATSGSLLGHDGASHPPRGIVLLAGGVRPGELEAGLGRPALELPLRADRTVFGAWRDAADELSRYFDGAPLHLRAMVSRSTPLPETAQGSARVTVRVEHDREEFRGTGGVLRDLAEEYDAQDTILVGGANQIVLGPLSELYQGLASASADFALLCEQDGTAKGLMLVRCGALMGIRTNGFIDLKEQALSWLAGKCVVRAARTSGASLLEVRTLDQYIRALHVLHGVSGSNFDPFAEEWAKTFSLVHEDAHVDRHALVHDSVVMRGARVGGRAVLVRSLVCPGAVVPPGARVTDTIVPSGRRWAERE